MQLHRRRNRRRALVGLLGLGLLGCSIDDLKPGIQADGGLDTGYDTKPNDGGPDISLDTKPSDSSPDIGAPEVAAGVDLPFVSPDTPLPDGARDTTQSEEAPARDGAADAILPDVASADRAVDNVVLNPDLSVADARVDLPPVVAACTFWNGTPLTWSALPDLPGTVAALAQNPTTGDFYASGTGVGMYRSTDRGATWSPAAAGLGSTSSFSGISVLTPCGTASVCTDVGSSVYSTSSTTWTEIASYMTSSSGGFSLMRQVGQDPNTVYAAHYDGLMRSDDGGAGWVDIGRGLPDGEPADVAIHPAQTNIVYVGTGRFGSSGQGVFKSIDRGATFAAANRGMLDVAISAVAVAADGTVYATSANKLYRSSDGGTTWTSTAITTSSSGSSIARIAVNEALGGAVFVLFDNLELRVSCDRGTTFQALVSKPTVGSSSLFSPPPLLVDVNLAASELILLAGHSGSGGFRATTGAVIVPAVDGGVVDGGPPDGNNTSPCPFWKSFRANSWQAMPDLPTSVDSFVADPASSDVFAGTSGAGVFKSTNQGQSWTAAAGGLPSVTGFSGVKAMALCGSAPTAVCVGIGNKVYATVNGGTSWAVRASDMTSSSGGFDLLVSLPTNPQILFGYGYTVFMGSSNGGAGWETTGTGFPDQPSVMAPSPSDQNLIYAGTGFGPYSGQGVYKSVDRGLNWTAANAGMIDKTIDALAVTSDGNVWAANGSTLFLSKNGGSTWTDVSAALPISNYDSIVQLVAGPAGSQALFALRNSLRTEVTCDGGTTWYTIVPTKSGMSSGPIDPVLLPLGNAEQMVLLAGTYNSGAFRLAVE